MVLKKIKEIIEDVLEIDANDIDLDAEMQDDLEIDSLDLFQIISQIEMEYDIEIEDLENIKTLNMLVEKVEKLK